MRVRTRIECSVEFYFLQTITKAFGPDYSWRARPSAVRASVSFCHAQTKTQAFGLGFSWWARLGLNQ
jgi:hypothetical protein